MAKPILTVVKEHCLNCIGGSIEEVKNCTEEKSCKLWPYRRGKNPYRKKVEMTEEQKLAGAERLRIAREKKAV